MEDAKGFLFRCRVELGCECLGLVAPVGGAGGEGAVW